MQAKRSNPNRCDCFASLVMTFFSRYEPPILLKDSHTDFGFWIVASILSKLDL
ncbi:MAG: hypothetical protein WBA39_13690 [Rivularia sp. (in: cyanobacteria)]